MCGCSERTADFDEARYRWPGHEAHVEGAAGAQGAAGVAWLSRSLQSFVLVKE